MLLRFPPGIFLRSQGLALCLVCLFALACSCALQEPPLSPAAKKFKREILHELKTVSAALTQPVAERNVEAVNKVLAENFNRAEKVGALLPVGLGVLDPGGFILARYPTGSSAGEQFSDYQVFKEVTQTKRIGKQVLYRPDGSQNYVIVTPLLEEQKLAGLLVFVFRAAELQDKWRESGQEFMVIDFNK